MFILFSSWPCTTNVLYMIIEAFNLPHNSKTELGQWLGDGELREDVAGGGKWETARVNGAAAGAGIGGVACNARREGWRSRTLSTPWFGSLPCSLQSQSCLLWMTTAVSL